MRTDLKMGVGKIAAQVGHATLGAYRQSLRSEIDDHVSSLHPDHPTENRDAVVMWSSGGQAKIAVKITSEQEMYVHHICPYDIT